MQALARRTISKPLNPWADALARVQAERRKRAEDAARAEAEVHGEEIRDQCKTLAGFIRWAWPILEPETKYVHGWHIDAIAEHLEAITRGDLQNLAINIPPAFMKSLLASVFWPAFEWGPGGRPGRRFLASSYEENLALRDNERMRALVTSPQYAALWGAKTRLVKTGAKRFMNVTRGSREARAFTSMTGGRGDVVLIDDPHSVLLAESDIERTKRTRLFKESIPNRVNDPETSAIVVIMQRLHALDVCGVIDQLGLNYERLVLPMEYEPPKPGALKHVTRIGFSDPRTRDGELLFPQRFSEKSVDELKKIGGYAYAGQYQQRPVPREGGMFKREWFAGKIVRGAPAGTKWVRHWDLAATEHSPTATKGARTAGVKLGRKPDGGFIVGHCIAQALDGAKVPALILATAEVDGKGVTISIPQDPGQAAKVQIRSLFSMLAGWVVRRLLEGTLGNKVDRAEPFAVQCEIGNVEIIEGPWNEEFLDELCAFPGGARMDIPDACSGAFSWLIPPRKSGKSALAAPQVVTGDTR